MEKKWSNGRKVGVAFLDGHAELHHRVMDAADSWTEHANLKFEWDVPRSEADVRVTFAGAGSWSQVGTDARLVPAAEPTLCLGWVSGDTDEEVLRQTVLHEFGHALGAVHEHQSPAGGVPWDRAAVYRFYAGPPNSWNQADVDKNIFARYDRSMTQFSVFDPDSIMIYPIPDELTLGRYEVKWAPDLSAIDREWMGVVYPASVTDPFELSIDGPSVAAEIGEHGEWDEFHFRVEGEQTVIVETAGPTDVVMALAGPDDPEALVAQDDDGGESYNARVETAVVPGAYVVRIWHQWPTGTGQYEVSVRSSTP